jgi:4-hydroxy-3-methylbut-2-en-1-yl diphosphate reductase
LKTFNVPTTYRSNLITAIKNHRKLADKMKKDFTPTLLDFGPLQIYLARHFGFCYGVENAIEIAFKTITENPNKKIYLLSEMIHNPQVNADLLALGVTFLQDTHGTPLIDFESLTKDDVVIIPAFGTTLAMEARLKQIGIPVEKYNTTCPFVEKVWNRSEQIAQKNYTVVIHGKPTHEETRATFSHAAANAPSVIVNDMAEAKILAQFITGQKPASEFYTTFENKYSTNFDVAIHLQKIGVVNQTTMLATDTQAIADFLKETITTHFGATTPEAMSQHFADTRDTLCYATTDNQNAVYGLLQTQADLAIVVGGYNSSNTSHLVELCEEKLPTFFIDNANKIIDENTIEHFNYHKKTTVTTPNFLPKNTPTKILITSGASCPDAMVEAVIEKLASYFTTTKSLQHFVNQYTN